MKYYLWNGNVHAYEADGSQDSFIPSSAVRMSQQQVDNHLAVTHINTPQSISRFQGRTVLKRAGLFQSVEAAISQADEFTQDAWADAIEWRRGSAMISALGGALGLTEEEIDELFITAASIEA